MTDGLWNIAKRKWPLLEPDDHDERLAMLIDVFGLYDPPRQQSEKTMREKIVRYRNDLVHEAKWDKEVLGTGGKTAESERIPAHLRSFNRRLIAAMLRYRNEYVATNWAVPDNLAFGLAP